MFESKLDMIEPVIIFNIGHDSVRIIFEVFQLVPTRRVMRGGQHAA